MLPDPLEQVSLGMAAADLFQLRQSLAQPLGGLRVIPLGMGDQPFGGGPRYLGPGRAHEGWRRLCPLADRLQQARRRFVLAGASQAVKVLQAQKWLHRVRSARDKPGRQLAPALADIAAGQFDPGQQRHRADLVLRIGFLDAPAVVVIEGQRVVGAALLQIEQRLMPPQMGQHEGIEIRPVMLHSVEKSDALIDAPFSQHHMGDGVLGPGLALAQGQGVSRRNLRFAQTMILLMGEGQHAMQIGHVRAGAHSRLGDALHAYEVAEIEAEILV